MFRYELNTFFGFICDGQGSIAFWRFKQGLIMLTFPFYFRGKTISRQNHWQNLSQTNLIVNYLSVMSLSAFFITWRRNKIVFPELTCQVANNAAQLCMLNSNWEVTQQSKKLFISALLWFLCEKTKHFIWTKMAPLNTCQMLIDCQHFFLCQDEVLLKTSPI